MPEPLFKTAPKEVLDYFDRRPSVPTFAWNDIAPREHALAWTAAKTSGFDVIEDLRAAAREAVNYKPFEQFQADLEPLLRAKGWWGRKIATDPLTGKARIVQLGSPRRLRTIYWGNVAAAQAAGEWARTQATKDVLPYLEYLMSLSERKRPEHQGWVGTTLPVDDPWWSTHYPPNGWNCKCRVRQISASEAERRPEEKRQRPEVEYVEWRNKRTGETEKVPVGIDPAWAHNPGLLRDRTVSYGLTNALNRLPSAELRRAVEQLSQHPFAEYVVSGQATRNNHAPIAVLPDALRNAIGARSSIVRVSGEIGIKAARTGASGRSHHIDATFESYQLVQAALEHGRVVQQGDYKFMVDWPDPDGSGLYWRGALTVTHDGSATFLSTWHRVNEKAYQAALKRLWIDKSREATVIREKD